MPKIIKRKGIPIKGWFLLPPLAIGTPVLTTRTLVANQEIIFTSTGRTRQKKYSQKNKHFKRISLKKSPEAGPFPFAPAKIEKTRMSTKY